MIADFDSGAHKYYVGLRELPSVTTVMQAVGVYVPWYAKEIHRQRGEAVHKACRLMATDRYTEEGTSPILIPFVRAYAKFIADYRYVSSGGEQPMASTKMGFAGMPDDWGVSATRCFCGVADCPGRCLLDIKSGTAPKAVGIQLAAYKAILREDGVIIDHCIAVELSNDETYRAFRCDEARWPSAWQSCLNVYNLRKEFKTINGKSD